MTNGYVKHFPVLPPNTSESNDINLIISRILDLVWTAWDLSGFVIDLGYDIPLFRWDQEHRIILRAELDANYAWLDCLDSYELYYILEPQDVYGPDFPGETFRVLKEKEIKKYGEYRTRRLVLEVWDRMQEAIDNGTEYVPMVDPPPTHPSLAHPMCDGSVYKGPGFVPVVESIDQQNSQTRQILKEVQPTAIKETHPSKSTKDESLAILNSTQTSDYTLYKCEVCGQMVMGFDQENHTQQMHSGDVPGFVKL